MDFNYMEPDDASTEQEVIEEASIALVREFLNRKGCKKSLGALDEEIPRLTNSICNRAELAQTLHVAPLLRKNKSLERPFRTIIEIIAWDLVKNSKALDEYPSRSTRPGTARTNDRHSTSPDHPGKIDQTEYNGSVSTSKRHHQRPQSSQGPRTFNPHINPTAVFGLHVTNSTKLKPKKVNSVEEMLSASPEKVMLSREATTDDKPTQKIEKIKIQPSSPTEKFPKSPIVSKTKKEEKMNRQSSSPRGKTLNPSTASAPKRKEEFVLQDLDDDEELNDTKCVQWLEDQDKPGYSYSPSRYIAEQGMKVEDLQLPTRPKKEVVPQKLGGKTGRKVEFNLKLNSGLSWNMETAAKLIRLVFGSFNVRGFIKVWINQAFTFRDYKDVENRRLRYGLVQQNGGPCGVLAAVQASILKHLLFRKVGNAGSEVCIAQPTALDVSQEVRTSCLAEAIIEILWRAGGSRQAVVALLSNRKTFFPSADYKDDGITEFVYTIDCQSLESLHRTVYENIDQFETKRGAVILLLYSAILSRGINEVILDMDDPRGTLMGAHAYCTQEMVNLLTVGVAASNTFDNKITLDHGMVLRGVTTQSDVGFLSLFEHYGSCTVGSNLKTPRYPVWIVCSESHFSVVFGLNRDLVNDWTEERQFDLYYYDGLANLDEEIRLTVDTTQKPPPRKPKDLIPPLELCLQTKWPKCVVDWNETDPLL